MKLILFEKSRVELEFVFSIFTSPETLWELRSIGASPIGRGVAVGNGHCDWFCVFTGEFLVSFGWLRSHHIWGVV